MMIEDIVGNLSVRTLEAALRGTQLRHRVIAQNLANIETPGYRRRILEFEEALEAALGRGNSSANPKNLPASLLEAEPRVVEDRESVLRADGNNVDLDKESVALGLNTGRHMALLEVLNREFRQMRTVIRGEIR